ncbi:histidinol-phosphate transaminase [Sphingomonas sp. LY160]|uniref:histidinol-phosphate transaminase n=1 Tax=Sphingomonas sp. LY160 TaxID=3095342 RepID=UPI002ADEB2F6|nr:histidinol-phosphate transaminase [Sphingomonas sp. LY160]MEA1070966.1 histidinol-phosphate transaminase [Sphingomonas sp. LY160]
MSVVQRLARPAILSLPPVDIAGAPLPGTIRLDANENPFVPLVAGQPTINRYPDPQPVALRRRLAGLYGVAAERLWVTRGSDDAIDLLIRAFCEAGRDCVGIVEPTFSAYAQFARVQGAQVVSAHLTGAFRFDGAAVLATMRTAAPKLLFLCTPNNPTGTLVDPADVRRIAVALPDTIIVADEAYGEFADAPSLSSEAGEIPNLVVLRTLSKAYGLAGARIGCAIGSNELIELLARVSPPYPLPGPSISAALDALGPERMPLHRKRIADLLSDRERLAAQLRAVPEIWSVREGGNFLFLEVADPASLAQRLTAAAIRVRFRPNAAPGGVRVTVGTAQENAALLAVFGIEGAAAGRRAEVIRDTKETRIALSIDLDRTEPREIDSGVPFYDHMLDQVAAHGGFAMTLACSGDVEIDPHHSIEDIAIALGTALREALGDKRGIGRFGFALPMDETEAQVLIDLSGRPFTKFDGTFASPSVGDLPTQMVPHVFRSLADGLGAAIHVRVEGDNDHHKVEACFKAFGRALRQALAIEGRGDVLPSTKGML